MKEKIELLESYDKIIAIMDRDALIETLVETMKTGAVEKVVNVFTGRSGYQSHDLERVIVKAITDAVVEKFINENYQAVYQKINLNTVANMAAVQIAKGVAQ